MIIRSSSSRKLRPKRKIRFPRGSCFPLCELKTRIISQASKTPKHRCTVHKQISKHIIGIFSGFKSYSCDPRKLTRGKRKKRSRGYLSLRLEMLLISRAGISFCAFVGTTNVPGEEARSIISLSKNVRARTAIIDQLIKIVKHARKLKS